MNKRSEMNHHFNSPYLTIHETSDYVRLAKRTLDNMRYMGTGPMFQKHDAKTFHTSMNSKSGHWKAALNRRQSTDAIRGCRFAAATLLQDNFR
jgi:hypothetical protein